MEISTSKEPDFLEYVRNLNGEIELIEALKLSLVKINDIDWTGSA